MEIVLAEIVGAVVIGWLGRNRKFGFWGYFFCALALTPLVGVIVLLASDPIREADPPSAT